MPMLHIPFRGRANLRNHRKLVIVDGKIAVVGGMNLAWPYIGPPGSCDLWQDLSMVVEGPAVSELEALFASDWRFTTGQRPDRGRRARCRSPAARGWSRAWFKSCPADPMSPATPSTNRCWRLIFAARDRIWIVTPYFVPDEMLARALTLAARRGVDVRLIVPAAVQPHHGRPRPGRLPARPAHRRRTRLALHPRHAPRQGHRL